MTLGDKIRRFRNLKGWTQKDLGKAVGFSASTADSRIRKYENDVMAPKNDIRQKLAEQLDVDISALSDISIQSLEDVMHILFFFEEELGMKIDRDEEKTTLTFDNTNKDIDTMDTLSSYLYAWYTKNKSINQNDHASDVEYKKWKGRFPRDLNDYWKDQFDKLDNMYSPLISKIGDTLSPIKKRSDFLIQIRSMIESGITIEADTALLGANEGCLVLTFLLSELLNESNTEAVNSFTSFLSCLQSLEKYKIYSIRNMKTNEKGTQVSYIIQCPPLMALKGDIIKLNDFLKNKDKLNDFDIEMFENNYKHSLNEYDIDLSEYEWN